MPVNRVAAVALISGDMILLGKRTTEWNGVPLSADQYPGYWLLFGGGVEQGESPIKCALRELMEETCIEVEPHDLKYIYSFILIFI